jgi:hypothetical protein
MRRVLASRGTPAALVGIVMLLIAGGGYALASVSSKNVNACVKKHSRTLYKAPCHKGDSKISWSKTGPAGPTGAKGATGANGANGANGAPGATGATGATGFVQQGAWAGSVSPIPGSGTSFVFAGPTTSLTTTAAQNISATGSAALGTSATTTGIRLAICKQASGAGPLTLLNPAPGSAYEVVTVTTTRIPFAAAAAGAPGAGTWTVGICVMTTGAQAVDSNDYSIGYAFVTNGPLTTAFSKVSGKAAHSS